MSNYVADKKILCTVEILTRNSARTLERCLESVKDFAEIIVLDGNSTDGTKEIARRFGCLIVPQYDTAEQNVAIQDYAEIRNKGLLIARFDWFMYIDSDEYLSEEVVAEIRNIVESKKPRAHVWWQERKYVYEGAVVDCATTYPNRQIRLFHKKWVNRFMKPIHERIDVQPGATIGLIKNLEYLPVEELSVLKKRWQTYLEKELATHQSASRRKLLKTALRQISLFCFYALRYVQIIFFCRGRKMPFRHEWSRHVFLLKYAYRLCRQALLRNPMEPHSYEPGYYKKTDDEKRWSSFPGKEIIEYIGSRSVNPVTMGLRPQSSNSTRTDSNGSGSIQTCSNRFGNGVKKLLDVGCGTGEILASLPASVEYTGIDTSDFAITEGKKKWALRPHTSLLRVGQLLLPFSDGTFDAVLLFYSLEHVRNPKETLFECLRVLKREGSLIIAAPNLEFPLAYPNALRHKPFWYRTWFTVLRLSDYGKRMFGNYAFRVLSENFTEATGRYEKKDDDLTHVVSSFEVIRTLERAGCVHEKFWDSGISSWRRAVRKFPYMRWYGTPLAAVFIKK